MVNFNSENWLNNRWENPAKQRYYQTILQQNLFGDWEIIKIWGRINSNLGRHTIEPCDSYETAITRLEQIHKMRKQRGYTATAGNKVIH